MRKRIPGVAVHHGSTRGDSATTLTRAGPYTVLVASTVSSAGVELHSTYLGHPAVDTRAVHLELARGHARMAGAEHPHPELPVTYALERLLLAHAARLRDLVAAVTGGDAAVDVSDAALAAAHGGGRAERGRR